MGAWGTSMLEEDVAADVYADFMERLDAGVKPEAIRTELEANYREYLEDQDDRISFWLALAKAQLDCRALQTDVAAKALESIQTGDALRLWQYAKPNDLAERKSVLEEFATLLRSG